MKSTRQHPHYIQRHDGAFYKTDECGCPEFTDARKDAICFPSEEFAGNVLWAWRNIGALEDCETVSREATDEAA